MVVSSVVVVVSSVVVVVVSSVVEDEESSEGVDGVTGVVSVNFAVRLSVVAVTVRESPVALPPVALAVPAVTVRAPKSIVLPANPAKSVVTVRRGYRGSCIIKRGTRAAERGGCSYGAVQIHSPAVCYADGRRR